MSKKLLHFISLFIVSISAITFSTAQVVINEVCSSNSSFNQDDDGDYPDWIELYNAGASTVNLFKYSISDDGTHLQNGLSLIIILIQVHIY